ncbi:hypothetical protein [Alysiella crassa]|uniref:hypothetical protein n=1 Tax=Alysiella crassa TaxID=153491 RepID=UPI001FCFAB87|nr:hypothetical protein [Alysiella crassa]UOP06062.1 hypothetical protein LVJ80_09435 [Alysiella crassa]
MIISFIKNTKRAILTHLIFCGNVGFESQSTPAFSKVSQMKKSQPFHSQKIK